MYIEGSGNIKSQIGYSINAIRLKVEDGDVNGVADHLSLLVAVCSPKLDPQERAKFSVPPLEAGRDKNGEKERKLFRECMTILSELLIVLSDKHLYAYKDVEVGDGTSLADVVNLYPVPEE